MSLAGRLFCRNAAKSDYERDKNLKAPTNVTAIVNVDYVGNKDPYNMLDVYYPNGTSEKLPVIVSIHGGGYVYGTKEIYKYYCMFLAQQGFTVVNFNYHLAPDWKFPAPLHETNLVLDWMCAHADKYYMDIDRVFLVGDSAGAQICSQYTAIATNPAYARYFNFQVPTDIHIRAIALNCGLYRTCIQEARENRDWQMVGLLTDYYGKNPEANYRNYQEMIDVLGHITENYPPTFVMTSYYDFLRHNAAPMADFLSSKGIDTTLKCYGTEETRYMEHVCHVNMNLEEAKEINRDECCFFREYM
ncbi:MAG: alpha/beta hydrolase [Lachnospiraceae bacterium]|nr:alpha/beta hydrolase [Lachnospiraceae bacterium]